MYTTNNPSTNRIILIGSFSKTRVIKSADILYLEANDNYCFVHLNSGDKILVTKSLSEYQKELCSNLFFRCHRSFLVNVMHVHEICNHKGRISLVMNNGDSLQIARRRIKCFKLFFKSYMQNPAAHPIS